MNLASVKCIISGGAQGLGRHFALRLCQAGAQVAIGDVNPQGLADTLELARGSSGKAHARTLDVSQESEVRAFVEWAHGAMGGLNVVLNNAGILRTGSW
jgi:3-oxoacyl-[acyl-carrier protein] reductase